MAIIKQYLPKSLLGRSVLIIVLPLILLQLVSAAIFYESHWDKVSLRLARGLAGDISAMIELVQQNKTPEGRRAIYDLAARNMGLEMVLLNGRILANLPEDQSGGIVDRMLIRALHESVKRPFKVDSISIENHVLVSIQLPEGVLKVVTNK